MMFYIVECAFLGIEVIVMEAKMLGCLQLVGAAAMLYFDRVVFSVPSGPAISIAVAAVLFLVMGLHHLGEKGSHKKR